MSARDELRALAAFEQAHMPGYRRVEEQATLALDAIDALRVEVGVLRQALDHTEQARPQESDYPTEREYATAIIDAYLSGFPAPYDGWHHIDNSHNDVLREMIKQLVARVAASEAALDHTEQDATEAKAEAERWKAWASDLSLEQEIQRAVDWMPFEFVESGQPWEVGVQRMADALKTQQRELDRLRAMAGPR